MSGFVLNTGRKIELFGEPYIIAEMNSSHNGNIETAKQMISAAKECGCDCVKFQSWTADTLYSKQYYDANPITKRIVTKFSFSEEQLFELFEYCKEIEIDFSSTPYSEKEVDFLTDRAGAAFVKIASMEINNLSYLEYIARKGCPIVLSTGMSSIDEIKEAVKTIEAAGNKNICILHCVSQYPAKPSDINLSNIRMLMDEFPEYVIGYSDHSIGYEIPAASVAFGVPVIEKHFTLDNTKMGMDNNMATEPADMKKLVEACRNVYKCMGSYQRLVSDNEIEQSKKMRRSLVANKDIAEGEVITAEMLVAKRPGDGIPPNKVSMVVGKKAKTAFPEGYQITMEGIE